MSEEEDSAPLYLYIKYADKAILRPNPLYGRKIYWNTSVLVIAYEYTYIFALHTLYAISPSSHTIYKKEQACAYNV